MAGNPLDCEINNGWNVNVKQNLDSNGATLGIPTGLEFLLKGYLFMQSQDGGRMLMTFRMKNFSPDEYFRILVDGKL